MGYALLLGILPKAFLWGGGDNQKGGRSTYGPTGRQPTNLPIVYRRPGFPCVYSGLWTVEYSGLVQRKKWAGYFSKESAGNSSLRFWRCL